MWTVENALNINGLCAGKVKMGFIVSFLAHISRQQQQLLLLLLPKKPWKMYSFFPLNFGWQKLLSLQTSLNTICFRISCFCTNLTLNEIWIHLTAQVHTYQLTKELFITFWKRQKSCSIQLAQTLLYSAAAIDAMDQLGVEQPAGCFFLPSSTTHLSQLDINSNNTNDK